MYCNMLHLYDKKALSLLHNVPKFPTYAGASLGTEECGTDYHILASSLLTIRPRMQILHMKLRFHKNCWCNCTHYTYPNDTSDMYALVGYIYMTHFDMYCK